MVKRRISIDTFGVSNMLYKRVQKGTESLGKEVALLAWIEKRLF